MAPIMRPPDSIGAYHWPVPTRRGWLTVVAVLALPALALSGCGSPTASAKAGSTSSTQVHASVPTTTTVPPTTTTTVPPVVPLATPAALAPLVTPPLAGEGQWQPAGRPVDGVPAVYQTTMRAEGNASVAGVAWMDTKLLKGQLYSGSISPGDGPWTYTAPVLPAAAQTLVCAFNGGFQMADAHGGYYTEGRVIVPLVSGAASLVIAQDGTVTVGDWGRDMTMTPDVMAVRQNLTLLVDNGAPVPGLDSADTSVWGSSLGGVPQVYRSGAGVTADGALVYVSGPSLNVPQLADLLVRAGATRAMELDINPAWDTFVAYNPPDNGLASADNGTLLLPSMAGGPDRFFEPAWARDFITMSSR
jgi:hypothetical protein